MITRPGRGLRWLVLSASLALLPVGCRRAAPPAAGESTARPAAGVRLASLPVAAITDLESPPPPLAGRVTLLNFWGTWCPPCRRELPGLARTATALAGDGRFQFVAVSCAAGGWRDPADLAAETAAFLAGQDLRIPAYVFSDPLAADAVATAIGLQALPTTCLVGPDGLIRRTWTGYRPRDEVEIATAIVSLLKELPDRPE